MVFLHSTTFQCRRDEKLLNDSTDSDTLGKYWYSHHRFSFSLRLCIFHAVIDHQLQGKLSKQETNSPVVVITSHWCSFLITWPLMSTGCDCFAQNQILKRLLCNYERSIFIWICMSLQCPDTWWSCTTKTLISYDSILVISRGNNQAAENNIVSGYVPMSILA